MSTITLTLKIPNIGEYRNRRTPIGNGMVMQLDGTQQRFHVRERDNRVAIVLEQVGWAAASDFDFWYIAVEDLVDSTWVHRRGSTYPGGVKYDEAIRIAKDWYKREASKR